MAPKVSKVMTLFFNSRQTQSVSFENLLPLTKCRLIITAAFKGEESYDLAAVRFEIDGSGGYIGTDRVAPGQYRGEGTLKKGEIRTWKYDLSLTKVAWDDKNGSRPMDFLQMLRAQTEHSIACWVSGGSESTVTVKLILE